MTRPRVPEEHRQRTAHACDTCKRRKQKCNGFHPCNTCVKRSLMCVYSPSNVHETDIIAQSECSTGRSMTDDAPGSNLEMSETSPRTASPTAAGLDTDPSTDAEQMRFSVANSLATLAQNLGRSSSGSDHDELDQEIKVAGGMRMLQDPAGQLLFFGESSTLSYLQNIRTVVEHTIGESLFTSDSERHHVPEPLIKISSNVSLPCDLPARGEAEMLIEAFLSNTQALAAVLDREHLTRSLDTHYSKDALVDPEDLRLLYLALAIGSVVVETPLEGERIDDILVRAEVFFKSSQIFGNTVPGLEDSDLRSTQALTLTSIYMVCISKWSAAYSYIGLAARSALCQGLHQMTQDTMLIFKHQAKLKRDIWRCIFVLDQVLSISLGRPTAILVKDCPQEVLGESIDNAIDLERTTCHAQEAVFLTCLSIREIFTSTYAEGKVSTQISRTIARTLIELQGSFGLGLDSARVYESEATISDGVAVLHVQLLADHAAILLTRPFFLHHLMAEGSQQSDLQAASSTLKSSANLKQLSVGCVSASVRSLNLAQAAYKGGYLRRHTPFISYFIFAAALIILSNEFANLHPIKEYGTLIDNALGLISYSATSDVQAKRILRVTTLFHDAIEDYKIGQRTTVRPAKRRPRGPGSRSHTVASLPKEGPSQRNSGRVVKSIAKRRHSMANLRDNALSLGAEKKQSNVSLARDPSYPAPLPGGYFNTVQPTMSHMRNAAAEYPNVIPLPSAPIGNDQMFPTSWEPRSAGLSTGYPPSLVPKPSQYAAQTYTQQPLYAESSSCETAVKDEVLSPIAWPKHP